MAAIAHLMTYDETKSAVMGLLATFGAEPRSLYDVGVPLVGQGYPEKLIVSALFDLAQEGSIELITGNRVRVLRLRIS